MLFDLLADRVDGNFNWDRGLLVFLHELVDTLDKVVGVPLLGSDGGYR